MFLPKQSPPVERKTSVATRVQAKVVRPQMTCECRTNTNGSRTYWCLIGRQFYNTGQTC